MKVVARVESLWRYPVKSMRGEELQEAFAGYSGIYGDRLYAFHSSGSPKGFPYLTGREQEQMLLYKPVFRDRGQMSRPPNLGEAEALPPGATPVYPEAASVKVDVETPGGETVAVDDPRLIEMLRESLRDVHQLKLVRSDRAMTDCRPISLFSLQTVRQLGREVGADLDKRRFRANVYLELASGDGFGENEFVGKRLQIGSKAVIAVTDRDPRCKMITLDPDTAQANPDVIKSVARGHDGTAGIYGAVLVEGTIRRGDEVGLIDE
jgi:uncharacterized protein YcbX